MKKRYKFAISTSLVLVLAVVSLGLVLGYSAPCQPASQPASTADSMKAIVARCYGGPEILSLDDVPKPVLADDDILVKVHAAAVNPLDWHYMRGSPYLMRLMSGIGTPDDIRVGVDFAGTVEAVGKDVDRFKPGDAVIGGRSGAFAEFVVIPQDRALVPKPANVTFEQAAAAPIAALTALQAVRDKGQVKAGQKVLINGASGGVGTFAVQIAKALGAEVTGVCSTRNVEMVRSIGADHVIDYKKQTYTDGEQRYDLIIDMVGNHSPGAVRKVLTPGGTLVLVGAPKGNWVAPFSGALKALIVAPFVDEEIISFVATMKTEDLQYIADLMEAGKVTAVIDRQFPLSEVPEGIRYSETGRARGKILINVTN